MILIILLSILPLIAAQTFAPTFVGCVSTISGPPLAVDSATSASECATYCGSIAASNPLFRLHSYYQQDGQNGQGDCQCTQFGPVSVGYEDSSSIAAPDVCADPASYSVFRLATTFVFDACYTVINNPVGVLVETVDSLEEVFEACRAFRNVFIVPLPSESGFQYVCATTETFSTPTTCNDQAGFFVFSHDAASTVSQLTRKRKRARARARAMREKRQLVDLVAAGMGGLAGHFPQPVSEPQREYCPKEMTACKVYRSEGAYECIDTSAELESCGGCMYGVFGLSREVAKLGVNCASLDDWSHGLGRKTCQSGNCVDQR